jgi:hypothetical protein
MAMRVNGEDVVMSASLTVWYRGELFTGEVVDTDDDGQVVGLTTYEQGLEHGPQYELFPDGRKKAQGSCDRGGVVGVWREWHANGNLAELNVFNKYSERVRRLRWDESGELVEDWASRVRRGRNNSVVREIFDGVIEQGWRPETSVGATEAQIDQVVTAQRVDAIPESVREILRLVGDQPGLWSAGSFFGVANMNLKLKEQARSILSDGSSQLGDGADMFVLFGHGGYEYHVIAGADLSEADPPVWLLREKDDDESVRVEPFWESVSAWFEARGKEVLHFRDSFAKRDSDRDDLLTRYFVA